VAWQVDGFLPGKSEGKKIIHPPTVRSVAIKGRTLKVNGFSFKFLALSYWGLQQIGGYSMNNKSEKRFYSPQFTEVAAVSVRRLAWSLGLPMTTTIDYIIKNLPFYTDTQKVCISCKDKTKCKVCAFNNPISEQEAAEYLVAM
jgi:hypothetical protein